MTCHPVRLAQCSLDAIRLPPLPCKPRHTCPLVGFLLRHERLLADLLCVLMALFDYDEEEGGARAFLVIWGGYGSVCTGYTSAPLAWGQGKAVTWG